MTKTNLPGVSRDGCQGAGCDSSPSVEATDGVGISSLTRGLVSTPYIPQGQAQESWRSLLDFKPAL